MSATGHLLYCFRGCVLRFGPSPYIPQPQGEDGIPRLKASSVALRATAITTALFLGSSLLHGPETAHASPDKDEQQASLLEHAEDYFRENPPAPPKEEAPDFGPGDRAVSAWDSGEITTDEMVRYGFLTAFEPDELPDEYQPDEEAGLDLGFYVPYVLSHLDEASEETQDWVEERTTPQMPEEVRDGVLESQEAADDCGDGETVDGYFFACGTSSSNFTVLYNIGTGDGVPSDDADGNGRPDAIDIIIDALEEAYSTYSNMGFDHASDGRITVLLGLAPRGPSPRSLSQGRAPTPSPCPRTRRTRSPAGTRTGTTTCPGTSCSMSSNTTTSPIPQRYCPRSTGGWKRRRSGPPVKRCLRETATSSTPAPSRTS